MRLAGPLARAARKARGLLKGGHGAQGFQETGVQIRFAAGDEVEQRARQVGGGAQGLVLIEEFPVLPAQAALQGQAQLQII